MSIKLTFACGHRQDWEDGQDAPVCATCGERRIARTKAPMPRFRGACRGPVAIEEAIGAVAVSVAPKGPLPLKEQNHGG